MAFQTGTATDLDDLFAQLMTFATANGWTQDQQNPTAGSMALHKNNVWVSFRYDPASEDVVSVHQALGYTGGNEPGTHPDDSGNGYNASTTHANGTLDNERYVQLGNGPFASYYFFENDSSPAYIHIVVEVSTDIFRHFGFGEMDKVGDWTGGEYAYGHVVPGGSQNDQNSALVSHLWDGIFASNSGSDEMKPATLHSEGLPGMDPTTKWGIMWGVRTFNPLTDTAGNPRVNMQGGHRAGPIARGTGFVSPAGSQSGLVPAYSIGTWYIDTTNDLVYFLGYLPDVRGFNIRFFAPKEEIVIGSDTWVLFPDTQKTEDDVGNRSYYRGTMYKKVTT